jgi:hypothetical protein
MRFPWTVQRKINTPAEEKLEQIKALLYPPLKLEEEIDKDGTPLKYHIDYSADSNLDAALMDLQEGHNDKIAHDTINDVIKRLIEVRKLLEAYAQLDPNAKYIIVDNMGKDLDVRAADTDDRY